MSDEEIAAQAAEEAIAEEDIAETDEQRDGKRKERLEQNRVSARESRKRKKSMIEGEFPHCSAFVPVCLFVPRLLGFVTEREDGAGPLASDLDLILLMSLLHSRLCGRIHGLLQRHWPAYLASFRPSPPNPNRSIISQNFRTPTNGHHPVPRQQGAQREERAAPPPADGHWRQGT